MKNTIIATNETLKNIIAQEIENNILRMKGIGRMLRDSLYGDHLSKCDIGSLFSDSPFSGDLSKCDTSNVRDMRNMCIQALLEENK